MVAPAPFPSALIESAEAKPPGDDLGEDQSRCSRFLSGVRDAPAGQRAVGPNAAATIELRGYMKEGPGRRAVSVIPILAPAREGSIRPDGTTVEAARGDLDERAVGSVRLTQRIGTPASDGAIRSDPAVMDIARGNLSESVGRLRVAKVYAPADRSTVGS